MSQEELLAEAMKLPEGERTQLADALLASLPPDPEWEAVVIEEGMRRMASWRAGEVEALDWREAMRQVREGLAEKKP
ncbi:MAG: addiction module protein [Gemmataceae bacterium]|nr:addiction module protein [Gemmataceae bacterium]